MSVEVTLTNPAGSKTITTDRSIEDAIKWFARVTTPRGTHYAYLTTSRTAEYAMLVRNLPDAVHTLEFKLV